MMTAIDSRPRTAYRKEGPGQEPCVSKCSPGTWNVVERSTRGGIGAARSADFLLCYESTGRVTGGQRAAGTGPSTAGPLRAHRQKPGKLRSAGQAFPVPERRPPLTFSPRRSPPGAPRPPPRPSAGLRGARVSSGRAGPPPASAAADGARPRGGIWPRGLGSEVPAKPPSRSLAEMADPRTVGSDAPACDLSVVVPVYKEEANISPFLRRIETVLNRLGGTYEIIFCLDPGPDRTEQVILEEIRSNPSIRLVVFSRRFGQPSATMAGLLLCRGDGR